MAATLSAFTATLPGARAATTLLAPQRVPLTWMPISWGSQPAPRKLGIHVALGGSTTPQLFEFDTGGAGFYPTYAAAAGSPATPGGAMAAPAPASASSRTTTAVPSPTAAMW